MAWELSDEHEMLRADGARVRRGRDRPARRAVGSRPPLPGRRRAGDGRARTVRDRVPRGVRRRRRRLRLAVRGDRGARPRRPVARHHAVGRRRARRQPDLPVRQRRPEGGVAARPRRRPRARRRSASPSPTAAATPAPPAPAAVLRGRRVGDQRRRRRSSPTAARRSRRSTTVTARTDERHLGVRRARPARPGFVVEPAYHKLGWHASDTHGITLDDCRVPEANLLGEPGKGFRNFLEILDDGRIAISALALGCARAALEIVGRLRQAAQRVRRPDRPLPGRRLPARRSRRQGRERPQPHLQGGVVEGPGPPDRRGRGDGQAVLDRGRRRLACAPPRRCSAGWASWRRARSPASTATPRSSRSAKARARSNGS